MRFDLNQRMNWGCRQEICWEPIVRSPGLGPRSPDGRRSRREVREAKGLVTLVENVRPAIGADVDGEGKGRIKARALPLSLCSHSSP